MAVLIDTSVLLLVLDPTAPSAPHPKTGQHDAGERIDYLLRTLSKARAEVLIPSPVLAELLSGAGSAASSYIDKLSRPPFRVVPFDTRSAIQCGEALRVAFAGRRRSAVEPRTKVKFDAQIVAIGSVNRVTAIYSDDDDLLRKARHAGLTGIGLEDLPLDPDRAQGALELLPRPEI